MNRFKGISGKLLLSVISLMVVACCSVGFLSYQASSRALINQVEASLVTQANDVTMYMEESFARIFDGVKTIAARDEIKGMNLDEQMAYLKTQLGNHEAYQTFGIVNNQAQATFLEGDVLDLSAREYIQQGLAGETAISEVLISSLTNEPAVIVVTPIDTVTGEKALLLAHLDGYIFTEVAENVKVGETGFALILTADGTVLGHRNRDWVKEQLNFIQQANEHQTLINEARVLQETVLPNESGIGEYESASGGVRYIGFNTLSNGWKVGMIAMEEEFLVGLAALTKQVIVSTILVCVIGAVITYLIAQTIVRPIVKMVDISEVLASGDFSQELTTDFLKRKDEVGMLAHSLDYMQKNTRDVMIQVNISSENLQQAAIAMGESLENIQQMSTNITKSVDEVGIGSTAQAQMADETSQSMEQMTYGIQSVADVAATIVGNTDYIHKQMDQGKTAVEQSIQQMESIKQGTQNELIIIQKLADESHEIGQISNMITEIANQTNLLALNAAIEAARAGEAGKGFAVVADEVKKLSEQTAASAAQINQLIASVQSHTKEAVLAAEGSSKNVHVGIDMIGQVSVQFEQIVEAISQISTEIEGMSAAAEQMSASTEQTSATMQEMSASAQTSNERVQQVTQSIASQATAVSTINQETERLEQMSKELQQLIQQFKI